MYPIYIVRSGKIDANLVPLGEKIVESFQQLHGREFIHSPVTASQIFAVPSYEYAARCLPVGEKFMFTIVRR